MLSATCGRESSISSTRMSGPEPSSRRVRAAVTEEAVEIVRQRVGDAAEVVSLESGPDLDTIDFLVPGLGQGTVEAIPHMHRLAVVQTLSAGADRFEGYVPGHVTLCSARGARDVAMSEWITGALLGVSTRLLSYARTRAADRHRLIDLSNWTVLIVGLGSIGALTKERLEVFGATVIGVASRARAGVFGVEDLPRLLARADAVVLLTPLNDSTRGLIGREQLAVMRDGAVLVNAGRGAVVDTDALLAETESGRLLAVLDVTDPEPLPADHPLRAAQGVLAITPHIAGDSAQAVRNGARLAGDQLVRWLAGEPLLNVVQQGRRRAPQDEPEIAGEAGAHAHEESTDHDRN